MLNQYKNWLTKIYTPPLFHHIFIIIFHLVAIYVLILVTLFKKLLNTCTYLFYTYLFTCFISTLFNLINYTKVRYLQSFVLILAFKAKLNGYSHIVMHFNIAKHTNIIGYILKRVEPSKKRQRLERMRNKI